MSAKIFIGCALAAACAAVFFGCPRNEGGKAPKVKNMLEVYAREAGTGSKKVRIGAVSLGSDGKLSVAVEKDVPGVTDALKNAVAAIQARKALKLVPEPCILRQQIFHSFY